MPNEPIKGLSVPDTGTLPGTWGSGAINPDIVALAAMLGGVQSISLSSATTFALSAGTGSITPGAGPTQSQNAILKFSGTLSGNAVITLPLPGYYIVKNGCTVGSNYIQLRAVGTGSMIGVPDGKSSKIWCDGTDVDFCDQPEVGSYLYLAMTTTPVWFAACSTLPYVRANGTLHNVSSFPALGARLGSTFGGNGVTTFSVPDVDNRVLVSNATASPRLTPAFAGFNGTTVGAAGGSQALQSHTHTGTTGTESVDHTHSVPDGAVQYNITPDGGAGQVAGSNGQTTGGVSQSHTHQFTSATAGDGGGQNVQPTIVGGIALIKT